MASVAIGTSTETILDAYGGKILVFEEIEDVARWCSEASFVEPRSVSGIWCGGCC
jgi:hypothetical protein